MVRVLLVEDEKSIRLTLRAFLTGAGHEVVAAADAESALEQFAPGRFDVLVSDVLLPRMNGIEMARQMREADSRLQVVTMTGEPKVESAGEAVRLGVVDYLVKPVPKPVILRAVSHAEDVQNLEDEKRVLEDQNEEYRHHLEELVEQRTADWRDALGRFHEMMRKSLLAMVSAVEVRDPFTAGHQRRVAELSYAIAQRLGLDADCACGVYYAGLVHDLGKTVVPGEILSSPEKLCAEARDYVCKHPRTGYEILKDIPFPWPVAEAVLQHHERMDGSGYPQGLSGDDTCIEASILAVADVVEAMANQRSYRRECSLELALAEIREHRGALFHADVVDACLALFEDDSFVFDAGCAPPVDAIRW